MRNVRNINETNFKEKFEVYIFFLYYINNYYKNLKFLLNFSFIY